MEPKNEIDIKDEDLKEEDFTPEELESDDIDWKAKAQELKGIAKRRATQLGKAKAKLGDYESNFIPKPKEEPKPQNKEIPQSNEPDYAKIAFLSGEGVKHPDDQKLVQDEAARLKLPLTDVLQMEHIKAKLEANKDDREAKAGMPKGRGQGGGKTQGDVDFWIDQKNPDGTFKTPEDPELAEKVIEARIEKEKSQNKFSDVLYTG